MRVSPGKAAPLARRSRVGDRGPSVTGGHCLLPTCLRTYGSSPHAVAVAAVPLALPPGFIFAAVQVTLTGVDAQVARAPKVGAPSLGPSSARVLTSAQLI